MAEHYDKEGHSSPTGGVLPIPIETRFKRERERLAGGFTDEDRAWRRQFLKDQELHNEPVIPPWYYREAFNPIRRAYKFPLTALFNALEPSIGPTAAAYGRYAMGKTLMIVAGIYIGAYWLKYNGNDWTRKGGWRSAANKPTVLIGSPDFPYIPDKVEGKDFFDRGFKNSPI